MNPSEIIWSVRDVTQPPYFEGMRRTYDINARLGTRFVGGRVFSDTLDLLSIVTRSMQHSLLCPCGLPVIWKVPK